jgi:plastocyanin
VIGPGRTFSRTFQTAGSFQYHCSIHPGMVGTVSVQ